MAIPIASVTGEIRAGKLMLSDRRAFDENLQTFKTGTQVELEVYRLTATRSVQANRYYWGVVIKALSDYTGYTPSEIHELMKAKFLPKNCAFLTPAGEQIEQLTIGGSTRELETHPFSTYMEDIKRWAADKIGLYIPDPNEGAL